MFSAINHPRTRSSSLTNQGHHGSLAERIAGCFSDDPDSISDATKAALLEIGIQVDRQAEEAQRQLGDARAARIDLERRLVEERGHRLELERRVDLGFAEGKKITGFINEMDIENQNQ
eukprot:996056_1